MGKGKRMKYKAVYSNDKKGKEREVELDWEYFGSDDCIDLYIGGNKCLSLLYEDWDNMMEDIRGRVSEVRDGG